MGKMNYIDKALTWAQRYGFSGIKAIHDDYDNPSGYTKVGEDTAIIPDISGKILGNVSFAEIAMKSDDPESAISKWKLLDTMAGIKGGKFFLLAPKGHKSYTEQMVKQHNLNATVIYLN